jgi:hypothetical protein
MATTYDDVAEHEGCTRLESDPAREVVVAPVDEEQRLGQPVQRPARADLDVDDGV